MGLEKMSRCSIAQVRSPSIEELSCIELDPFLLLAVWWLHPRQRVWPANGTTSWPAQAPPRGQEEGVNTERSSFMFNSFRSPPPQKPSSYTFPLVAANAETLLFYFILPLSSFFPFSPRPSPIYHISLMCKVHLQLCRSVPVGTSIFGRCSSSVGWSSRTAHSAAQEFPY